MKKHALLLPVLFGLIACNSADENNVKDTGRHFMEVNQVKIEDSFWKPKFTQWETTTAKDVLDKFEGKNVTDKDPEKLYDTFENFDLVAAGKRDIGKHAGFPWFDGLVYETIRGLSDLMAQTPNSELEQRLDGYIDRIAAAQASEKDGFINTYTQLVESNHRWGENGGLLRWMHDVYNSGMLVEAGVHYYKATGKTKLLEVATRQANLMCDYMGPEPKHNVVPAHSGAEEPLVKLYWLYKQHPELKEKVNVPVNEQSYLQLAEFWIENRGHHCGLPLWGVWGNEASEKWIKENKYADAKYGKHSRPSFGPYAQDSIPVFEQQTIEGHAVRATLLMTGVATTALENGNKDYIDVAKRLWDNMVGKRMFVTGGVGAVHFDEKFGPDYYLPTDAYLETCAAVGLGFYSQRMNELVGDAKYMDEFERSLYNNVLTGISLSGNRYTYQNPLNSEHHARWEWHDCPCCPPMFLKLVSAVPGYIYSHQGKDIFVNLFIGSNTDIALGNNKVHIDQQTLYPWEGAITLNVNPEKKDEFALKIRIPGWARSVENPYGLYKSTTNASVELKVNGESIPLNMVDGYAEIRREWSEGDKVELSLPMQPRVITASQEVKDLNGLVALAAGPLVYSLEACDNKDLADLKIKAQLPMEVKFNKDLLGGVNVIEGKAVDKNNNEVSFTAIPYYAVGNRDLGAAYKVWLPAE